MRDKILVIGSSNVDFIMKMERLPKVGESVPNGEFLQTFGGKGANQAVAAARAGGEVVFVNCVGDDAYGVMIKENMRRDGIDDRYIRVVPGAPSGAALVMVGEAGQNYLSVALGANGHLTVDMLADLQEEFQRAAMVVLQYEIPPETVGAAIEAARAAGAPVMFNFAPLSTFDLRILPGVDHLVVNETEAQFLCGFAVDHPAAVKRAGEFFLAQGVRHAIITLGAGGAYVARAEGSLTAAAFQVEAVDTTAAGDTFCGALAVALSQRQELPQALRFANAAAALCVTRLGAQPSIPHRAEIDGFLAAQT